VIAGPAARSVLTCKLPPAHRLFAGGPRKSRMQNAVTKNIEKYLADKRCSRETFAKLTGVSISTLNKILSGDKVASPRMLLKISTKTGLQFEIEGPTFEFDLYQYERADVAHLEGSYQTLRPSFREARGIQCFETLISWNNDKSCLGFMEIDNDLSPGNAGYVSVPLYQRIIYLLSVKTGNFRLAALSDAYEAGIFYGGLLTVASPSLSTKAPASSVFVIKRISEPDQIVRGMITSDHACFSDFDRLLSFARDEGFFKNFPW
jgi:transcriptional regulator with XRE-family HTH domain